jgi:hypothetical protein
MVSVIGFWISECHLKIDFRSILVLISEDVIYPYSSSCYVKGAMCWACETESCDGATCFDESLLITYLYIDWIDNLNHTYLRNWVGGSES